MSRAIGAAMIAVPGAYLLWLGAQEIGFGSMALIIGGSIVATAWIVVAVTLLMKPRR